MTDDKRCENCGYCIRIDQGYSSYTVTGTDLYCWLDLNPAMPYDEWFQKDKRGLFANECPSYDPDASDGFHLDIDGWEWDDLTPAQQTWCDEHDYHREAGDP